VPDELKRYVSPSLFALAFICLFLPFTSLSCGGQEVASFSTIDLAVGQEIEGERINSNLFSVTIIALILLGIFLGFKDISPRALIGVAAVGVVALLGKVIWISIRLNQEEELMGAPIEVSYETGFYFLFLLFLAVVAWNIYRMKLEEP